MKKFTKPLFVFSFLFFLAGCSNTLESPQTQDLEYTPSAETISINQNNIDLGDMPILGGKVETTFSFQNNGDEPIVLISGETSCMCTEAVIKNEKGDVSPRIKMAGHGGTGEINQVLDPGETAVLTAIYDPLAHGPDATGPIKRNIFIKTSSVKTPVLNFSFFGNVIKGEKLATPVTNEEEQSSESLKSAYQSITPEELYTMLQDKDFTLIDTHIPQQKQIPGTDLIIPYNKILDAEELPTDKNSKIVLYCRSGGMSRAAAYQLAEKGYTNVYDLVGGKNAYDEFLSSKE